MPLLWDIIPICTIFYLHQLNFTPAKPLPEEMSRDPTLRPSYNLSENDPFYYDNLQQTSDLS